MKRREWLNVRFSRVTVLVHHMGITLVYVW
jgi:hypothetical protein